mgnify:CR=1 FL=1
MSISNASCTPYARAATALPPWGVSLAADGWRPASNVSRADKLQSIIDYYNSTLSSGGGGDGGGGGSGAGGGLGGDGGAGHEQTQSVL